MGKLALRPFRKVNLLDSREPGRWEFRRWRAYGYAPQMAIIGDLDAETLGDLEALANEWEIAYTITPVAFVFEEYEWAVPDFAIYVIEHGGDAGRCDPNHDMTHLLAWYEPTATRKLDAIFEATTTTTTGALGVDRS